MGISNHPMIKLTCPATLSRPARQPLLYADSGDTRVTLVACLVKNHVPQLSTKPTAPIVASSATRAVSKLRAGECPSPDSDPFSEAEFEKLPTICQDKM
jgi:hypothetical protein